jgi:hypothetical protein
MSKALEQLSYPSFKGKCPVLTTFHRCHVRLQIAHLLEDIKEYTKDNLKHAFDCISEGDSTKITVSAMGSSGGVYSTLFPIPEDQVKKINPKVQMKSTLGYTVVGEYFKFGLQNSKRDPGTSNLERCLELSRELLEKGAVQVHHPAVNMYGKGLDSVLKDMQAMHEGKVSGKKLVFVL